MSVPTLVNWSNATGPSPLTVNAPAGIQDGDLLIAFCTGYGQGSHSRAGWTQLYNISMDYGHATILYRIASSEGASWAFSGDGVIVVVAYRGIDGSEPIDAHGGVGMSYTAPSVTTTADECAIVRFGWSTLENRTHTFASGTELWDVTVGPWQSSSQNAGAIDTQSVAGATGTCVITPNTTKNFNAYGAATVVIGPAGAAPSVFRNQVISC